MNKLIAALVAGLFATAAFAQASGTMAPAAPAADMASAPAMTHHKRVRKHKHHPIKAVEKAAKSGTQQGQSSAQAPKN